MRKGSRSIIKHGDEWHHVLLYLIVMMMMMIVCCTAKFKIESKDGELLSVESRVRSRVLFSVISKFGSLCEEITWSVTNGQD